MMGKMILGIFLLLIAGMAFALPDYRVGIDSIFNSTGFMTIGIRTFNQGTNANSTSFTNDTYDSGQGVMHQVPPLAQSQSYSYYHNVTCTPGQWVALSAQADVWNNIGESNENNNFVNWATICPGAQQQPDLTVSALSVPTTMIVGRPYAGTVTTRNAGTGAAGGSTTNVQANGQFVANIQVLPLAPGATSTGSFQIQCSSVGRRQVLARADSTGMVSESNENNNLRTATVNCLNAPTNRTNETINISTMNIGGGSKNPYVAILNALGISLSDELLNAICMGR
jgi:hypothetical protein